MEIEQVRAAAPHDAKAPYAAFASDGEAKRRAAAPRAATAVERWMSGIDQELERLRKAGQCLPG